MAGGRPRVLLVPLDDRPVTRRFPARLARLAGWEPRLPPAAALGHFLRPGRPEQVMEWLRSRAARADAVAATLEGLVFGGLVASREPGSAPADPAPVLAGLRQIRRALGKRPLVLASTIMRLSITARSREHLRWWSALHRWCELWEPADGEEAAERARLTAEIPPALREGLLEARRVKHAYNLRLLELLADGTVDTLLLFQEDCTPRGPHRAEQRELRERARALGVADRLHVLPGTDEGLMLLLARVVLAGEAPPRVATRFTAPERAELVPAFEDRPVRETAAAHVAAAGARPARPGEVPDLVLLVHPPAFAGADHLAGIHAHAAPEPAAGIPRDREERAAALAAVLRDVSAGSRTVAVADAAYANGADAALASVLARERLRAGPGGVPGLAAYAGWNTAANSIGTALAWGLLRARRGGDDRLQAALLAERLGDDWLYQVEVRPALNQWVTGRGWDPWNLASPARHASVSRELARRLLPRWRAAVLAPSGLAANGACRLPWPRTFECELEVSV